jgi:hypothetical protein
VNASSGAISDAIEEVLEKVVEYNHLSKLVNMFLFEYDLVITQEPRPPYGSGQWRVVNRKWDVISDYHQTYSEAAKVAFSIVVKQLDATQAGIAEESNSER